jgi:regulator of nucleoside diphosphate kinase
MKINLHAMQQIIISSKDAVRIQSSIDKARSGGIHAPINLQPLANEINNAKRVDPEKMPPDVVTMNSIVVLQNLKTNKTLQVQIVYPEEADMSKNKVSIFAPVGTALLGYRIGDTVKWKVPSGIVEFKILELIYQPESSKNYDL